MSVAYCPSGWTAPRAGVDRERPDYVQPDGRRCYMPWATGAACPLPLASEGLELVGCDEHTRGQYAGCGHGHHREIWRETAGGAA